MADDFDAMALGIEMMIPQIIDLENESKLKTKELDGYLDSIWDGINKLKGFIEQKCISTGENMVDVCERFNVPMKIKNPTQGEIIIWGRTLMVSFAEMDATEYAPPEAIKTVINENTPKAETAQEESRNMSAELTNLTQEKDDLGDEAVKKRELLRNSLTRMLPKKRYDKRLDDYGFDVWNKPSGGGGEEEEEPEPGVEWPDWPGPVEGSAVQVGDGWVRITYSGLNGGKTLRIERLRQGDTDYVLVTQGLPLDDPEEVMPFDDTNIDKKKYTYKLTPFDEGGNPGTPAFVGVTVS